MTRTSEPPPRRRPADTRRDRPVPASDLGEARAERPREAPPRRTPQWLGWALVLSWAEHLPSDYYLG